MTQPPIDPDDEPLGGALTPSPDEMPTGPGEPRPPVESSAAAPPPPEASPPGGAAGQAAPSGGDVWGLPPAPPTGSGAFPPPPPSSGAFPPPPPSPGGFPPPPPASFPPPQTGGFPPPPGAYPYGAGGAFPAAGVAPHRAALVLGLAIAGLLCCQVLSIPAFVLSKRDMAEMDAGRMDPSGRGTTNVARILGIVGIVWLLVNIVVGTAWVLSGFAWGT